MPEEEAATPVAEFLSKVHKYTADADELIEAYTLTHQVLKTLPVLPEGSLELTEKTVKTLSALKYLVNMLTEHQLEIDDAMARITSEMEAKTKKD